MKLKLKYRIKKLLHISKGLLLTQLKINVTPIMINEEELFSLNTPNKSSSDESFISVSSSKKIEPIYANYSVKKKKTFQIEENFLPEKINATANLNPPLIKRSFKYKNMLINNTNECESSYCNNEEGVDERKFGYESKEELYAKIPFRDQVNSAKHLMSTELGSQPKRIFSFCNKREQQRPKIPPPRKKSHQAVASYEFTPKDILFQGFNQTYDEISDNFTKHHHISQFGPPALSALGPTKEKDDKIRPTLSNLKRSRSKIHGLNALDNGGEFLEFKSKFIPNYYNNAENKTFSDTIFGKIGRSNSSSIETGRIKHTRMRKFSDQIKYKNSSIFNLIESKPNILSFSKERKKNVRLSKTLTNKKRYRASISLKLGKKYQILTSHSDVSTDGSITSLNYWQLDEKYSECSAYQQYIPGSVNDFSHSSENGDLDVTESPYATIDNNDSAEREQSSKIQNLSQNSSNIYLKPTFYESARLADLIENTKVKKTLLQLTIDSNLYKQDENNYDKIGFDIYQPLPTYPAQSTKSSVYKPQINAEVRSCFKNDDEGFVDGCPQNIKKRSSAENFVEKICENNFVLFIKNFCVNEEDFVNEHTPLKFDNEHMSL